MKKLLLALFIMGSGYAYSQTSVDEYNYLTKGYSQSIANGLGIKQGYSLTDKGSYTLDEGGYTLQVSVLYLMRTADNSYAAALVMVHDSKKNNTAYFCVPAKNSDQGLWNTMLTDIRNTYGSKDKAGYEAIMYAMMHLIQQ